MLLKYHTRKIMDILKRSREELGYMQGIRRTLHQNPELSHLEFNTQKLINEELDKLGIPHTEMAGTGVVALIKGAGKGKTVLIRADMDALPIQEDTGVSFSSVVPNVMHACGHDGHIAGALGAAKILNELKANFRGNVKIMFQPSEEYDSGAKEMVDAGVLKNPDVDFAIGCHLWGSVPCGKVGVRAGGFMAAPDAFKVTIKGKGGHGSTPDRCDDLILMAAEAIQMIYANVQRKIDAFDNVVVSVCSVHAGTGYNILPDSVEFVGTIRHYNIETRKRVMEILHEVMARVTLGTSATFEIELDDAINPVINDADVTEKVKKAAEEILGSENVIEVEKPDLGGDDFSYVTDKVPSSFFFVGLAESDDRPIVHHSSSFAWNDEVLAVSCAVLAGSAIKLL